MTDRAGDSRLRRWMVHIVETRIVEFAREKHHWVVTASAEPRCLDIPVPLKSHSTGFPHRKGVGRIVERTEPVHAVRPALVGVSVTVLAVRIVHQHPFRN